VAIELRAVTLDDVDAVGRLIDAQDVAWWGAPDGDLDDVRDEFVRAERAAGSLEAGGCVAVDGTRVIGVAMLSGHGQTTLAVDPAEAGAARATTALLAWALGQGADQVEAPAQDIERLARLAEHGFVPARSSFELERSGDVSDLTPPAWPDDIAPVPFRVGVDDQELHAMIYSFWTDVPGHVARPIEEWRSSILAGSWFDAEYVVVARSDCGDGPIVGCALGRTFTGDVGWVSQLGVAPAARRLGLGRAVLLEICHRLGRRGPRVIGLGVEAENAGALGLYRSVGMEIAREWVHCRRRAE
jgi:ribosomal protein S18 acetylase RimI-like enzyme